MFKLTRKTHTLILVLILQLSGTLANDKETAIETIQDKIKGMKYSVYAARVPREKSKIEKLTNGTRKKYIFSDFSLRIAAGAPKDYDSLLEEIPAENINDYPHLAKEKRDYDVKRMQKLLTPTAQDVSYEQYSVQAIRSSRSVKLEKKSLVKEYTYAKSGAPSEIVDGINYFDIDSIHGTKFTGDIAVLLSYDCRVITARVEDNGSIKCQESEPGRKVGGYATQSLDFDKLDGSDKIHIHINRIYVTKFKDVPVPAVEFRIFRSFKNSKYNELDSAQKGKLRSKSKYMPYV